MEERIDELVQAVADEFNRRKVQSQPLNIQRGKVVFDSSIRGNTSDWSSLVNGVATNNSIYHVRFPKPFNGVPVVTFAQQRKSAPGWRFVEIVDVTNEMFSVRCNYWGSDLVLHWMAMDEETA
ncbi:H-type lectin domain-containing protein [Neisseria yangbaofengii]|uniref:H-type lectin domain-containing protein n=1 Tax=Neisseria yangbaofengii TaxID=2709396 RepID=UPI0013EAE66A|nr:H-type lectin domain-containing protein [Neisseria yangbaofengii]